MPTASTPTVSTPAASRLRPALVSWDVDHTPQSIGGSVSRTMCERAFRQETSRSPGDLAEMPGRTEQALGDRETTAERSAESGGTLEDFTRR